MIWLIFLPLLIAPLLYLIFGKTPMVKYFTLGYFVFLLLESFALLGTTPPSGYLELGSFLSVEAFDFVLDLRIDYLSAIMLILTSALLVLVTLSSWSQMSASYFALLLFFSGPIFGVFATTNLLWFFIFWELTLVPMYFLVGIWGGERRIYAAVKFFLYTHVASMLILLAFFILYKESGYFDITMIKESMIGSASLVWWLLFIGFAVKMPIFPFHTWLPDAHVQAPAPISVLLAGVLLKMGAYAMIRFAILLLPHQAQNFAIVMVVLGVITLVYAGFMALYETHLKKMIAYSSISHMGLVLIAIATLSFDGLGAALYEMIAHAFIISPLFLIAGILHHKTGSWQMHDMGGLMQKAPYLSAVFVIAGLGALGMPFTMGFIGEFTILISAIKSFGYPLALIALGSIIAASYMIWSYRRVIYGELSALVAQSDFRLGGVEFGALVIFALVIVILGIFPHLIFESINTAFAQFVGGAL
ncbi:MAG: NADH-quinone oxidoreductase subunit M [Sulfurovum sp. FS08-3]|nr:MAG: NADH-quinone oxidoreductase subunit M [Sulfurovum sp. FS08-3]